ncbi:MAG: hypothetical protein JSR99_18870 [Proteobacteria bacterium]|nr:hypothetical protein [Pseudomonadota bacterium]
MSPSQHVNKLKQAMQDMAATSPAPTASSADASEQSRNSIVQRSRLGKRAVTFHIDEAAQKQLRLLCVDTDRTSQSLLEEALNDLFRKHIRSAIA